MAADARLSHAPSVAPVAEQAPRVLLFDGSSALADAVIAAMDGAGCELRVMKGGENLAEAVATFAPDLVLVDVGAKGGAFALCGELRSTDVSQQVPIVLASKDPLDEATVTRGLMCGADDFVSLAGRMAEFQARIRVQLRHKRDRDRLRRVSAERDNLRREAAIDPLTQLPNRRTLDAYVETAWSAGAPFAIVFVDVDDFKQINDGYGHDVGDNVLRNVSDALRGTLRDGDRCGRWGGEEFILILRGVQTDEAARVADAHRKAVEAIRPAELGGRPVTASFGVAIFDPRAPDPSHEGLCQRADSALYEAKRSGKNRVAVARSLVTRPNYVSHRVTHSSAPPQADRAALESAVLKELANGRAGLPILPEAAQQAMSLAEDPRTDMGRIARLVDRDPPLAARFVAIAGSALYSRGVKPVSTHAALVRIGLGAARDLLLQIAYERSNQELPVFRAEVARSFQRSVKCGVAARLVASELRVPLESAYLCGLLHDIGESRIYRILAQMPLALQQPEFVHDLVARHHQRAGADVARAWHLSSDIVEACAHHHATSSSSLPVKTVIAADALVRICEREDEPTDADLAVIRALGLSHERVAEVIARTRATFEELSPSRSSDVPSSVRERPRSARPSRAPQSSRYPRPPSLMNVRIRSR